MLRWLQRLVQFDRFLGALVLVVLVAGVFPASGRAETALGWATKLAIGLLFFLHGARISSKQALDGLKNVKLHLAVFACTFALFPALAFAAALLPPWLLSRELVPGFVFLGFVPSTMQAAVAFTALVGGDVAAASVATSVSSLLGVFLTPALTVWALGSTGRARLGWGPVLDIVAQLLVPFLAGQAARRWVGAWARRHEVEARLIDQGSVLLVVYAAFSLGVTQGIWQKVRLPEFVGMTAVCGAMLAVILGVAVFAGRAFGFDRSERAVLLFCGSKKSLSAGLPLASVLFAPAKLGVAVLPLMVFHQMQLMVCALLAGRLARRRTTWQVTGPSARESRA
ncbi:bile acid:sodium symporter family protein [Segniliparus rugosus]|uniref:Bile acid:sodium symporter n=1 Tax=Segniliparus rugosus (strain ATCC BAA-974 / DSM 45345 / CCUG 50838 / CIP 108380 / JCM 13579 / CDC 945) TaxID=679197 RepID=E5XTL9_SEGRC|nr:bile acid:sodium symporter family protein [Segniliparus rugosus]EFV12305.1 hypothetical protein HMPREF9336_02841 [Segniliparus rugosus ATCC BAA-974]